MLPSDHDQRMQRTLLSFDGLSVGDAFGDQFVGSDERIDRMLRYRSAPTPVWKVTDDTIMALAIVTILQQNGEINQDLLALEFARRYAKDPNRGYGGTAHGILRAIGDALSWETASSRVFDGMGSLGNGGAMRVAPLGAYFADDLNRVSKAAKASAEVTHFHPEGQAGAMAVAIAAAFAWNERTKIDSGSGQRMLECVLEYTPKGETRTGVEKAYGLDRDLSVQTAVGFLGNGLKVSSPDTVPFVLWCAARHLDHFEDALWNTVSGMGDRDTTCAMVGGIVALSDTQYGIPQGWIDAREKLSTL